jgi:hypothetical protein
MNPKEKQTCEEFTSLLVKKISGEILSEERRALERHLAHCASCVLEERELSALWQRFRSSPGYDIPRELYENTRRMILGRLKQEKSPIATLARIPSTGAWRALVPSTAGLAMTAISYGLIHRFVDVSLHHHYVLLPLFGLWWLLFTAGCWLILRGSRQRAVSLDVVSATAISITLLTLFIGFLSYELELLRSLAMSASYQIAAASAYLFGVGNTFVTAWWVHCCLASFIGAFIFGVSTSTRSPANLFVGSLVVMILLSPAIYLQGASHNHGLGVILFAALGTYVGAVVGMGLGLLVRRNLSFQFA